MTPNVASVCLDMRPYSGECQENLEFVVFAEFQQFLPKHFPKCHQNQPKYHEKRHLNCNKQQQKDDNFNKRELQQHNNQKAKKAEQYSSLQYRLAFGHFTAKKNIKKNNYKKVTKRSPRNIKKCTTT